MKLRRLVNALNYIFEKLKIECIKKAVIKTARYPIANSKPLLIPCLLHIHVRNYSSLREQNHCLYIDSEMQWYYFSNFKNTVKNINEIISPK